ncbi:hypothetical protein BAURA86_03222 [Brevibacterium aurantiacum]|uniref:Uncharacterized protein n=1 Tax=Brevibacterium aurantiacum TaxID=273384 RepID=A0A2H1KT32_BREAU|nr:hypothetical protein BAURA86_03222 [Brevibacterium aurantiacum]
MIRKALTYVVTPLVCAVAWPVPTVVVLVVVLSLITGGVTRGIAALLVIGVLMLILRAQFPSVIGTLARWNSQWGRGTWGLWTTFTVRPPSKPHEDESLFEGTSNERGEP